MNGANTFFTGDDVLDNDRVNELVFNDFSGPISTYASTLFTPFASVGTLRLQNSTWDPNEALAYAKAN
jgi:hypothetical protein